MTTLNPHTTNPQTSLEPFHLSAQRLTMRPATPAELDRLKAFYRENRNKMNCPRTTEALAEAIGFGLFLIIEAHDGELLAASGVFPQADSEWLEFGATFVDPRCGSMGMQKWFYSAQIVMLDRFGFDLSRAWCTCQSENSPSLGGIEASAFQPWLDPDSRLLHSYGPNRPMPVFYRLDPGCVPQHQNRIREVLELGFVERKIRSSPLGPVERVECVPLRLSLPWPDAVEDYASVAE